MAFVNVNNVKQLSNTSGTADYQLTGTVSDFDIFDNQMSNGDQCFYGARDNSGQWEVGIGTFVPGGTDVLQRTTIVASSNGGAKVSWPGTGTRDIIGALPAETINSILLPGATVGIVCKQAVEFLFQQRTIAVSPGNHLSVTNPDGVSGNPTIVDSIFADYLRGTGGSVAERTATSELFLQGEINLEAVKTIISGFDGSNEHTIYYDDPSEKLGKFVRVGAGDFEMWLNQDGVMKRVATGGVAAGAPATVFYLTGDKTLSVNTTLGEPVALNMPFPSTPDGSKYYRVSMYLSAHGNGTDGNFQLYMGPNGTTADLLIFEGEDIALQTSDPTPNMLGRMYPVPDFLVKPALATDKLHLWLRKHTGTATVWVHGGQPAALSGGGNEYMGHPFDPIDGNTKRFCWIFVVEHPYITVTGQ
jgi:hypothetical protein